MERRLRAGVGRLRSDPFARSIAFAIALILGGFVAIGLGWRGAARSLIVAEQLPFLISGGLGGLALIVAGAGTLAVQASRYWNARELQRLELIVSRAARRAQTETGGSVTSRVSAVPK
jgi:MFS family permease